MQSPIPLSYMWHTVYSTIHTQVILAISVNQAIFTRRVVALPFVVLEQKPSLALRLLSFKSHLASQDRQVVGNFAAELFLLSVFHGFELENNRKQWKMLNVMLSGDVLFYPISSKKKKALKYYNLSYLTSQSHKIFGILADYLNGCWLMFCWWMFCWSTMPVDEL